MKKILSILFLLPSLLFGQSYIDQYGTLMNPGFDNKSGGDFIQPGHSTKFNFEYRFRIRFFIGFGYDN